MKTLHILLKDRQHELQKDVPDSFKFCEPQDRGNNDIFVLPDIVVNLSQVVAMWVTNEDSEEYNAGYRDAVASAVEWFNKRMESLVIDTADGESYCKKFHDYMVEGLTKDE